jgi:hypothetical protein
MEEEITLENNTCIEEPGDLQGLGWLIVIVAVIVVVAMGSPAILAKHSQQSTQQTQQAGYSVLGPPSISAQFIDQILCKYGSPACGTGQALYDLSQQYNIDDAFALAVFFNESTFGTQGEAQYTRSLGNLRPVSGEDFESDGYAGFNSWPDGYRAFYSLIAGPLYVQGGLTTPETILARYAPSDDSNDPQHYATVVESAMSMWRAGRVELP